MSRAQLPNASAPRGQAPFPGLLWFDLWPEQLLGAKDHPALPAALPLAEFQTSFNIFNMFHRHLTSLPFCRCWPIFAHCRDGLMYRLWKKRRHWCLQRMKRLKNFAPQWWCCHDVTPSAAAQKVPCLWLPLALNPYSWAVWAKQDHWVMGPHCTSLSFQAVGMLPVEFHVFRFFKFYLGALQRLPKAEGPMHLCKPSKNIKSILFALCTNLCSDAIQAWKLEWLRIAGTFEFKFPSPQRKILATWAMWIYPAPRHQIMERVANSRPGIALDT